MIIIVILLPLAYFGILGLITWCASDLPLIKREIALNTRKDANSGPAYSSMNLLSIMLKVVGALIWVAGIFVLISQLSN